MVPLPEEHKVLASEPAVPQRQKEPRAASYEADGPRYSCVPCDSGPIMTLRSCRPAASTRLCHLWGLRSMFVLHVHICSAKVLKGPPMEATGQQLVLLPSAILTRVLAVLSCSSTDLFRLFHILSFSSLSLLFPLSLSGLLLGLRFRRFSFQFPDFVIQACCGTDPWKRPPLMVPSDT